MMTIKMAITLSYWQKDQKVSRNLFETKDYELIYCLSTTLQRKNDVELHCQN